jgi:hypothetical protein
VTSIEIEARIVDAYAYGYVSPMFVNIGVEYMAAIPARKSRAKSLPPVADAAYSPYAAIV